jgi:hypothetical protein
MARKLRTHRRGGLVPGGLGPLVTIVPSWAQGVHGAAIYATGASMPESEGRDAELVASIPG